MAKAVGGPLDGMFFSVVAEQETIEGFNDMPEGSKYVKEHDTQRDFIGNEQGLVSNLFDQAAHNLTQVANFRYVEK